MNLSVLHGRLLRDVLPLDAVIGTKVRALADRGLARDLIDVHAASKLRSNWELESLGRRYSWEEFDLENLTIRLAGAQWRADEEFSAYGLTEQELANLRSWAQGWSDEILHRRNGELIEDYDDQS